MPLLALRQLVSDFNDAVVQRQTKEDLYLVNKLKHTPVENSEVSWFTRNLVGGLSPLVSPMQSSPLVSQGTYRQIKAGSIVTRHVKRFTNKELNEIMSPDDRFRLDAKRHLFLEMQDMERRIWETMEYTAWSAMARGSVRYLINDPANRVDVNVSFPINTETAGASWATISTDIVTDVLNWVYRFENRYGKRPDVMRMTRNTWNHVRLNTSVKNVFTSYLRTTGVNATNIPVGMLTPDMVAKACDWPTIEIFNHRTSVQATAKNSETAASNVVIELNGGTWGFSVGDKALCKYNLGDDTWDFENDITAVNPGVSITVTIPSGKSLAPGDLIVAKPTFFPEQKVQFIADEDLSEFILPPFGIDYSGSEIQTNKFRGPYFDAFNEGREPNLAIYRRAWHEFGMAMGSKITSAQVIV